MGVEPTAFCCPEDLRDRCSTTKLPGLEILLYYFIALYIWKIKWKKLFYGPGNQGKLDASYALGDA